MPPTDPAVVEALARRQRREEARLMGYHIATPNRTAQRVNPWQIVAFLPALITCALFLGMMFFVRNPLPFYIYGGPLVVLFWIVWTVVCTFRWENTHPNPVSAEGSVRRWIGRFAGIVLLNVAAFQILLLAGVYILRFLGLAH